MLAFLMILPLIHRQVGDLGRDGAVTRAEQILAELGCKEQLSLTKAMNSDWSSKEPSWTVEFKSPKGPIYMGLNSHTGKVNRLEIQYLVQPISADDKPPTPENTARVQKILRILGSTDPLIVDRNCGWNGPFRQLVHGHPFFNLNPCYGPSLSVDATTGLPSIYYASPPMPSVNAWEPRVAASFALDQIRDWGHARAVQRGLPAVVDPSVGDLEAELGYWKPKGSNDAILVWRATKYSQVQGKKYGIGTLRMFVNALTGEFVEPDDPLWGPDP